MGKVRLGVIGAGGIGNTHLKAIEQCTDMAALAAVCDIAAEVRERVAQTWGVDAYADYHDLLKRDDIEAVIIALPHHLHEKVAVAALQAGKHVLLEKPLARSLEEGERIVVTAKVSGKRLLVGGQSKFLPTFQRAKELIASGVLGDIFLTRGTLIYRWEPALRNQFGWRGFKALSGGVAIIDAGWHLLELLVWLRGMPQSVLAMTGAMKAVPNAEYDVDDKAALLFNYADGGIGTAVISYVTLPSEWRLIFHGTKGVLEVTLERLTFWQGTEVTETFEPEPIDAFSAQLRHFLGVVQDVERPIRTPDDALAVIRLIEAAYLSAKSGLLQKVGF